MTKYEAGSNKDATAPGVLLVSIVNIPRGEKRGGAEESRVVAP